MRTDKEPDELRRISDWPRRWLEHRYLPWHLALLAMLLCAPSLWLGWHLDDDFHRLALTRPDVPLLSRSPADLFVFIEGDEVVNRQSVVMGMLPWWSHEKLRIAFFRPLTGLTHWVDYKLWPSVPSLMHLHSLVWFGGVVVAAGFLYRRIFSCAWVAGLAALLFAVDDAHGLPAVWLANRNALLGVFFGLLTLIAHDRWRRNGSRLGAMLAPLMLLLGLLSKESTVAIGAYLVAYALFLDRGRWVGRIRALVPYTIIVIMWWATYRKLEYGTVGSGWYLDPGANLVGFARAVAARAPNLLAWQWLIPSDLEWALSGRAAHGLWLGALGFLMIVAVALVPLLQRDRVARFWALGMALSVLPACAAYPAARLLTFVGIGGMGLVAQLVGAVVEKVGWLPTHAWRRLAVHVLCVVLILAHVGMAPVALARRAGSFKRFGNSVNRAAASFSSDSATPFQTVVVVNTPVWASFAYGALMRLLQGDPILHRTLILGSSSEPIEIHRTDAHTLIVRPRGGFLAPVGGSDPDREMARLLFNPPCGFYTLDRLYRDDTPMTVGQRIELLGVAVEITAITDDGRPSEAAFHFVMDIENPLFRWLQWMDGVYVPFELPAVGDTVTLPAAALPL